MVNRYQGGILGVGFNPLQAPDAPTIGTASAVSGTATSVVFTAPANVGGSAITSYVVISSPGGINGTGSSSPITVSGLTLGTAYTFRVTALNSYGPSPVSAASNSVQARVPGAPTSVSATAGNAQAAITFTAPADTGNPAGITGYRVTSSPGGITATGASSPITITGLTNGTSYTFTVAAQNAAGFGAESSPSGAVTPTPPRVTNLGVAFSTFTNVGPTITLEEPVPAGSLIFIFGSFAANTGNLGPLTITSSVSQTWSSSTVDIPPGISGQVCRMFGSYSRNSAAMAAGETINVIMGTLGGNGQITACVIRDVLTTAAVFDASVYNTASNTFETGSATISGTSSTQANEVIIYGFISNAYYNSATSFTQASGYASPPNSRAVGGTNPVIGGGHKITTGAGQSAAVTNTTNGSNPWGLMVYGFKAT